MKWQDQLKERFNEAKEKAAASINKIDEQISTTLSNIDAQVSSSSSHSHTTGAAGATTVAASATSPSLSSAKANHQPTTRTTNANSLTISTTDSGQNFGKVDGSSKVADRSSLDIEVVVEELRFEFFKACQEDHPQQAYRLYTMTWDGYIIYQQERHCNKSRSSDHPEMEKLKENFSKEWNALKSNFSTKLDLHFPKDGHFQSTSTKGSPAQGGKKEVPGQDHSAVKIVEETSGQNKTNDETLKKEDVVSAIALTNSSSGKKEDDELGILERYMLPNDFFPSAYFHAFLGNQGGGAGGGAASNMVQDAMSKLKNLQNMKKLRSSPTSTTTGRPSLGSTSLQGNRDGTRNSSISTSSGRQGSSRSGSGTSPLNASNNSSNSRRSVAATTSATAATTTTPLHEAARIAYPPLLRRMMRMKRHGNAADDDHDGFLLEVPVDLTQQDWKQRTPLHYICGGVRSSEQKELTRDTLSTSYDNNRSIVMLNSTEDGPASSLTPPSVAQSDSGMKSFYFSMLEKKRTRELMKKEKVKQVLDNIKSKVTTTMGSTVTSPTSNPISKTNHPSLWSQFVDSTTANVTSSTSSSHGKPSPSPSSQPGKESEATKNTKDQQEDTSKKEEDIDRLECLTMVLTMHSDQKSLMDTITSYHNTTPTVGINTVDCRIRTALHYAASLGRYSLVKTLIQHCGYGGQILVSIVDEEGHTSCEVSSDPISQGMLEALAVFESSFSEEGGGYEDDNTHTDGTRGEGVLSSLMMSTSDETTTAATNGGTTSLSMPFSWFETVEEDRILEEMWSRVKCAKQEIKQYLDSSLQQHVSMEEELKLALLTFDFTDAQLMTLLEQYEWNVQQFMKAIRQADEEDNEHDATRNVNGILFNERILKLAPCPSNLKSVLMKSDDGGDASATEDDEADDSFANHHDRICQICYSTLGDGDDNDAPSNATTIQFSDLCGHEFCRDCVIEYINTCYVDPRTRIVSTPTLCRIPCPHFECGMMLPQTTVLELLPNEEQHKALRRGDVELFVLSTTTNSSSLSHSESTSSKEYRFCPFPNCTGIVHSNVPSKIQQQYDAHCSSYMGAVCTACSPAVAEDDDNAVWTTTYEGVRVPKQSYYSVPTDCSKQSPNNSLLAWNQIQSHRFCFTCGTAKGSHFPASCTYMERWRTTVATEMKDIITPAGTKTTSSKGGQAEKDSDDDKKEKSNFDDIDESTNQENFEDIAHRLWIKANTRPCPKCKLPIEKNDGCNHMTCTNRHCRYEFCWICRKDWKLHSSKTGGYFRCNRWADNETQTAEEPVDEYVITPPEGTPRPPPTVNEDGEFVSGRGDPHTFGTSLYTARMARRRAHEMNRFIHHYSRWTSHRESSNLEQQMAKCFDSRFAWVLHVAQTEFETATDHSTRLLDFGNVGLSFVYDAFTELLECRTLLQHSYVYAYFRFSTSNNRRRRLTTRRQIEKLTFEQLQSELEMITEQLSDIVARSHLRASRAQIQYLTSASAERRTAFSMHFVEVWYMYRQKLESAAAAADKAAAAAAHSSPMAAAATSQDASSAPMSTPAADDAQQRNTTGDVVVDLDPDADSEEEDEDDIGGAMMVQRMIERRMMGMGRHQQEEEEEGAALGTDHDDVDNDDIDEVHAILNRIIRLRNNEQQLDGEEGRFEEGLVAAGGAHNQVDDEDEVNEAYATFHEYLEDDHFVDHHHDEHNLMAFDANEINEGQVTMDSDANNDSNDGEAVREDGADGVDDDGNDPNTSTNRGDFFMSDEEVQLQQALHASLHDSMEVADQHPSSQQQNTTTEEDGGIVHNEDDGWLCSACTFQNSSTTATEDCAMCGTARHR